MKKIISVIILFIIKVTIVFAQPANDNCNQAQNLGTLSTPGACVSGLQDGAPVTFSNLSNLNATATNPYIYMTGCSGGGSQEAPALDVWYSFVASGTTVNLNISGFPNASVGVWTGNCNNLTGRGCMNVPAGGSGTLTITQIVSGQTYLIQISGGTATATDPSFSLTLDNDIDCNDCNTVSSITASPLPVNGGYTAGQVVTFCYTVSNFSEVNTNWFHGVQISMGSGWTGVVSSPVPSSECNVDVTPGPGDAGDGVWAWYPTGVTSTATDISWPMGFYFDNANVGGTNAGNNYGDPGNCGWTFCWNLTVGACTPGMNLNVTVNTTGDGESGSWVSPACGDDATTTFVAIGVCCGPPTMSSLPVACYNGSNGSATATPGAGSSPWDYVWANSGGTIISTTNNVAGSNTISGLTAGTYSVTVTDNNGCAMVSSITVVQPVILTATPSQINVTCNGGTNGVASVVAAGGTSPYTYNWSPNGFTGDGTKPLKIH